MNWQTGPAAGGDQVMRTPTDFNDTESPEFDDASLAHSTTPRRHFLKCMAWAGAGTLFLMKSGVLEAKPLDALGGDVSARDASFSFVQISDSHIGFHKEPN